MDFRWTLTNALFDPWKWLGYNFSTKMVFSLICYLIFRLFWVQKFFLWTKQKLFVVSKCVEGNRNKEHFFFLYTHCKRSLVVMVVVGRTGGYKWNHRVRLSVCLCAHFRARPSVGIYVGMMLHAHVTSNRCNILWKYVSLLLTIWRRAHGFCILIGHSVSILKGFFFCIWTYLSF